MQPTIVSRCQPVPFSPVPLPVLTADLVQRCGLGEEPAELVARVSGGNLAHARELATSESARRQRDSLLDLARDLPCLGLLDTEIAIDDLMTFSLNEFAGKSQNPVSDPGDGPGQPRVIKPATGCSQHTVKRVHNYFDGLR